MSGATPPSLSEPLFYLNTFLFFEALPLFISLHFLFFDALLLFLKRGVLKNVVYLGNESRLRCG